MYCTTSALKKHTLLSHTSTSHLCTEPFHTPVHQECYTVNITWPLLYYSLVYKASLHIGCLKTKLDNLQMIFNVPLKFMYRSNSQAYVKINQWNQKAKSVKSYDMNLDIQNKWTALKNTVLTQWAIVQKGKLHSSSINTSLVWTLGETLFWALSKSSKFYQLLLIFLRWIKSLLASLRQPYNHFGDS